MGLIMTYSLRRVRDDAGDAGGMCTGYIPVYDPDTNERIDITVVDNARPQVGMSLRVGSIYARTYSAQDWWQTTLITEIIDEWTETEDDCITECVRFKTGNSIYIWKKF